MSAGGSLYSQSKCVTNAHKAPILSTKFHRRADNSEIILTGAIDDQLRAWLPSTDTDSLSTVLEMAGSQLAVISVDRGVYDDRHVAATSSMDGIIRVYDLVSGEQIRAIDAGATNCWSLSLHPTKPIAFCGSHHGIVNSWNILTGEQLPSLGTLTKNKFALRVTCSPNGEFVAVGFHDGAIQIFDTSPAGTLKCNWDGETRAHHKAVRALAFSRNSQLLASGGEDLRINLFKIESGGEHVAQLTGHNGWVTDLAFSPAGDEFASSSCDHRVCVWSLEKQAVQHTFEAHTDQVWSVSYNFDGTQLASVSDDKSLRVFSIVKR